MFVAEQNAAEIWITKVIEEAHWRDELPSGADDRQADDL